LGIPVNLLDDILGYTIPLSVPSLWQLPSNGPVKLDGLWHKYPRSLFELGKPFSTLLCPNIALVPLFSLESHSVLRGDFEGFEIVVELDFLVEDFLVWVVSLE
jgi:hypothetical protein